MSVPRLRVALISTPFIPVPPREYGGTELIVAELARALHAQGVEVVVYATGDSVLPDVEVRSYFPRAIWPPAPETDRTHAAWALRDIARDGGFDVVHSHSCAAVELAKLCALPLVHTVHHDCDEKYSRVYAQAPHVYKVAISGSQAAREISGADFVVHHGLSPERFQLRPDAGYLLFLGRYSRVKAPHLAIEVAERAGLPLVMAGRSHDEPGDASYRQEVLGPLLAKPHVRDIGPIGGPQKAEAIARARAVLFPIDWEEPFGLVMIESMLSGVPVLALRRGSVPEIIEQGLTGAICNSTDELVDAARDAHRFDRASVRARALRRFTAGRMAANYLAVYRKILLEAGQSAREAAVEKVGA